VGGQNSCCPTSLPATVTYPASDDDADAVAFEGIGESPDGVAALVGVGAAEGAPGAGAGVGRREFVGDWCVLGVCSHQSKPLTRSEWKFGAGWF
jgi:hypothetical protein